MKRILALSCSKDVTVDVVLNCSASQNITRLDSDKINSKLFFADFSGLSSLNDYDVIWYRRPFEFERKPTDIDDFVRNKEWKEVVWNFLLQTPQEKWMNYPATNWYADRKLLQLQRAPSFGLLVPPWLISSDKKQIEAFVKTQGSCLVKPIDNGYIPYKKKLFHIYSTTLNDKISLKYAKNCPTLFQKIVDKAFDVRTLYVDGEVLFFKLKSDNLDVRENGMDSVEYSIIEAPSIIREKYRLFVKSYGLRFCTSDFVVDETNQWFFLENNPNGNWAWLEKYFPGIVVNFFVNSIK